MSIPNLSDPLSFLTTMLVLNVIITGRYFLACGIFYLFFYRWFRGKWADRKIGIRPYNSRQFRREIGWSIITAVCFSFTGTLLLLLWQKGFTKVYTDINEYPLWWIPVSLVISLLIDETYYYWLHRWMHSPRVFKLIHKVHHQSSISSPWTSFSFHPVEGMLLSVPMVLTLLFIPMFVGVVIFQLVLMTISSIINHLDIEVYSEKFRRNRVGKLLIGATHHAMHHKQFKYNFGLYFTFWDKWKKTESPSLR